MTFTVNKAAILKAIIDTLRTEFDTLQTTSQKTRAAGNDSESKAEGKYDTRSTEDNYLADGLARQAHAVAQAGAAYKDFIPPLFSPDSRIDLGALVQLAFTDETHWFFLGPAGGGIDVISDGIPVTVLTPESRAGKTAYGPENRRYDRIPEGKGPLGGVAGVRETQFDLPADRLNDVRNSTPRRSDHGWRPSARSTKPACPPDSGTSRKSTGFASASSLG